MCRPHPEDSQRARTVILRPQWHLLLPRASPHSDRTQWQKSSFTREPPKTKAELRQMLSEAVRNTQPRAENGSKRPKAKMIAARAAYAD
jgi:hypothetical protein